MMTDTEVAELVRLCCSTDVGDLAEAIRRLDEMRDAAQYRPPGADRLAELLVAADSLGGPTAVEIVERVLAAVWRRYAPKAEAEEEWLDICARLDDVGSDG